MLFRSVSGVGQEQAHFLTHDSPVGWKGEKMRLFLTDTGYSKALENQEKGHIKIRNHAKVLSGDLHYDHKGRER